MPPNLMGPTPAAAAGGTRGAQQKKKAPAALSAEKRDQLYAQLVDMGEWCSFVSEMLFLVFGAMVLF